MEAPQFPACSKCGKRNCHPRGAVDIPVDIEGAPSFCPMKIDTDALNKAWEEYQQPEVLEFARQASIQEFQCYEWIGNKVITRIPRLEETIQLAQKMGYKKLGLAFCLGLASEALTLDKILQNKGFEVVSVCCKAGGVAKEKIGIKPEEKIRGPATYESMCNPIGQAEIMNKEMVDWVILLGLCVGHDTLFLQYCKRPVTVLAVKDRVLAHNPLGALYLASAFYYSRLMAKD